MHVSLDGFVAGPNGEMNWIKVDQDIFNHVALRINKSDTALYGRVTYEMMEGYWPTAGDQPNASKHDIEHSAWYKQAHKVVLSRSMKDVSPSNTTIISENVKDRIDALKSEGEGEILLFGSPSATHALMELDAIDGYWIFLNPIVLGKGIPLFSKIQHLTKLQLQDAKQFGCGVAAMSYVRE